MPTARYRCTWDDIPWIDADHMASWGAFEDDCKTTVDFHDEHPQKLAFEFDNQRDAFSVFYVWNPDRWSTDKEPVHRTIHLDRRPCRFGGARAFFICPSCSKRKLRLAVLPTGLCCGACGSITWKSRRETPTHRLIRKANKIAVRLGADDWTHGVHSRPKHMRLSKYDALLAQRHALSTKINQRIARYLARALHGDPVAIVQAMQKLNQ